MRASSGAVVLLCLLTLATTSSATPTIQQVAGNVLLFELPDYSATNYVAYIGRASVTVVGATWTPKTAESFAAAIKSVTPKPITEVIDISPDPEWSGGNAYWQRTGAKVYAISATYDLLKGSWGPTETFVQEHGQDFNSHAISLPDVILDEDFELQNGAVKVLFLGPSHTPGDVFVYFPNEGILDAGSIVKEQLGNLAAADLVEYPKTLARLMAKHLYIKTVVSGHWTALHGPDIIDDYLTLLQARPPQRTEPPRK